MLLWTLLSAVARAQDGEPTAADTARAKELYENGAELYAEGLYAEAILAWQEGYAISKLPDFLFNIAGAQERLGQWRAALDTLSQYRAFASTEERETLARRIRNLEERIADEGPQPQPAPQPQPGPSPAPAPAPTRSRASLEPVVVGSLFGVAGVGVVTGLVSGLGASAAGSDARELCVTSGDAYLCPSTAEDLLRRERSRALVADLAFGLASAGVLGGVAVLVIPNGGGGSASIGVGPGSATVTFVR